MLGNNIVRTVNNWWVLAIIGLLYIAGGIYCIAQPEITFAVLALVFGIMLIADGISSTWVAIQSRQVLKGWGWVLASGVLSILLGVVLLRNQEAAQLALILLLSVSILVRGGMAIALSLEIKNLGLPNWGWGVLLGVLVVLLGVWVVAQPGVGVGLIVALLSISFIAMGVQLITAAMGLRRVKVGVKHLKDRVAMRINGLAAVVNEFANSDNEEIREFVEKVKAEINEVIREMEEDSEGQETTAT